MALTEQTVQDKIEIVGDYKIIHIRSSTIIKRDGVEISRSFSRHVVTPDADVSGESDDVKALATQFHTDAIKTAYAKHLAENTP
jgi:predicted component of viral defense system (DUF524 family)|tara:strand:- start:42 stop:293 length:252 start_codon:yes stop_codon:yes gene_type:complete